MLLDPLALTVFDDEHSQEEDRWFTLGTSSEDKLLTVAHTFEEQSDSAPATVRIISARPVKRREREQYENEPRQVHTMSTPQTPPDDDLPAEIDFAGGTRGKFYKPGAALNLPVYLDAEVQNRLARLANAKGIDFSALVNAMLRKDIELIEIAQ